MKHASKVLILGLALAAAGCDNSSSSGAAANQPSGQQASAPGPGAGSGFVPGARPAGSQPAGGPATTAPAAQVALDLSSAEAALKTYLARLGAGDLTGAADACRAGAPGAEQLRVIGANLQAMLDNPEQRSLAETSLQFMVGELKTAEWTKLSENETEAVFQVKVINKAADNIMVVKEADGWRVVPPANQGMPGMVSDNAN